MAQAINTEFGKNRVQFHDDFNNWSRYETENFICYWYGKSRNLAQVTVQMAEMDHDEIQRILEHTLSDKIEIIVYIDITDLKQSNIGLEEAFTSQAGRTKIVGSKMFISFDGDHLNLRKQIRQGITNVYLNSILFGSSLQEIVQNALLLNLPDWFKEGLIAFGTSQWDYMIDDELRDLLEHKEKYHEFKKLAKDHPRVAGHSMWNYIANQYGPNTIPNIIYLTRLNRKLENSFLFVLGEEYDKLVQDWYSYYKSNYSQEINKLEKTSGLNELDLSNKKGVPVSHLNLSPDGQFLAYVTNDMGKAKVYVRNLDSGEEKMIFKHSHKNIFQATDFNYPLIDWHPTRSELSILYEKRDILKLRRFNLSSNEYEEQDLTQNFQRIYSIAYIDNDDYLFSASDDGYSDLFIYESDKRNHRKLTEDYFDDLEAQVIEYEGETSVLFSSNRTDLDLYQRRVDTILPIENFDLYILKGLGKNRQLIPLTQTRDISERQPFQVAINKVLYVDNHSGINNSYVLNINTGKVEAVSNLERNIIFQQAQKGLDNYVFTYYHKGNYKVYYEAVDNAGPITPFKTKLSRYRTGSDNEVFIPYAPEKIIETDDDIPEGFKFQSPYPDPEVLLPLGQKEKMESPEIFDKYFKDYYSESVQEGKRIIKYNPMRASAARLQFRLADFTTRIDNDVLFEGLESYTGNDKELTNAPVGILFKGTMQDLFEDYEIQVGLRIPTSFNGYEYFFVYDNNKKLLDKRIAFYRKSESVISDPTSFPVQREKRHSFLGLYRLKYPFDIYRSVRLTSSLRFDKYYFLSTDAGSFNEPISNEKRLSIKAEYVYDNSFDVSVNIKNGTRYKIFAEAINQFNLEFADGFDFSFSKGITGVFGADARHYVPIFKYAVLALRASAATSIGSNKVVYYLGGMENWIFAKFDESIPLPRGNDFSYKMLAPHLRGFKNNIRNGNTFILSNAEIRIPIFQFLGMRNNQMSFLRNFQITGFFDAGLAWYGLGPDAEDNPLNTIEVQSPPDNPVISIEARYFRDPLVMGYGFGLRTTLLGYFMKFDYAWGIETRQVQKPRWYISMGMDF
jgi:hypothetical protein